MKDYYYDSCKDCTHLYHCYGRETGEKIEEGNTEDMYQRPGSCRNYYPEIYGG